MADLHCERVHKRDIQNLKDARLALVPQGAVLVLMTEVSSQYSDCSGPVPDTPSIMYATACMCLHKAEFGSTVQDEEIPCKGLTLQLLS